MCQGLMTLGTDILYPRVCPICDEIVRPNEGLCCKKCRFVFEEVKEPRCKKCSKPLNNSNQEYCFDCASKKMYYKKGYAMWVYDGACKDSVLRFKYQHRREYVDYYVKELYNKYHDKIRKIGIDAFIPVPIHIEKEMTRGYNQATLIANKLGDRCGIPVYTDVLYRKKYTKPQKELSKEQRNRNLLEAFAVNNKRFCDILENGVKKILIIDDIYTTGNTINSCAKKLSEYRECEIYFLCLCIGRGIGR